MESLMKVNALLIKQLRDERAWSQEHLAEVAGLSLRTVQRMEAEGSASAETRMALASALGVSAATLTLKAPVEAEPAAATTAAAAAQPDPKAGPRSGKLGLMLGLGGATLGAILACVGIANSGGTPAEAGMSYGIVGLVFGLTCATMGIMSRFLARKPTTD